MTPADFGPVIDRTLVSASNGPVMKFRLIPKDENFSAMFRRSAENVGACASALVDFFDDPRELEHKLGRITDLEHAGDAITHEIFDALDRSFVTPFERDDIARLAGALDDVVDWSEDAALRFVAYKLGEPTPTARRFARIIADQAAGIVRAVPLLADPNQLPLLGKEVIELHRLENEADKLMFEVLATLYDAAVDVPGVVRAAKWKDIYQVLEQATDRAEHVGIALRRIMIKLG
jgi:predicted phosphate transport protein (TIGR00153 family)